MFPSKLGADGGIPIPAGTWTPVLTHGLPAQANGWEQLVYVPPLKQSIMLAQYHQRNSEPNESLVGYNFDTNSWDIVDMGGNFHTEAIPEGGESQGYFGYNPNTKTIIYHCCTTGSNQSEDINHDWWYDVMGQSGRDKHTSPKPPAPVLLPGGSFDTADDVFILHGGAPWVGTWAYDPVANSWRQMHPTGNVPDESLDLPGVAYSTVEKKIYLFGGHSEATGLYPNDVYVYDYPTNTWTLISVPGARPAGRTSHAFAYDSTNNVFLLNGGLNAAGVLSDTWVYNPVTSQWTQVTTPAPPPTNDPVYAKMSYDSDHNVFVMAQIGGSGGYYGGVWHSYAIQTWLFRYAGGGPNAGTQTSTAAAAAGGLNRYVDGWAKDPALSSSGNSLYVAWSEASSPFTTIDDAWPHIYVSQYSGGSWMPLGQSFASISGDIFEAHQPSIAIVGGTPWVSYYQSSNTGQVAAVDSNSWDGVSTWNGGAVGYIGSGTLYQGQSQITPVGGVPYVALLQEDRNVYPQRTLVGVMSWTGSAWALKGATLNQSTLPGATALEVSISSDGVNPAAAWSEYIHTANPGDGYDHDSNPQIYASRWNGSQWVVMGGSLNFNTSNWAYDPSIAYANGTFYVAWVERTQAGNNQLYVKSWNGSSWTLVGSGALNIAPLAGWAYHPSLVANAAGDTLYLGWVEQTALGQKAKVFVARYNAGIWTNVGGALNVDPVNGSAQRVSIGVWNGQPVAAWGEVNMGATRQVFVKAWSGSSWIPLPGPVNSDTTPPPTPGPPHLTVVSSNQVQLTWGGVSDLIGVAGYYVTRNRVRAATVTSTYSYNDTGLLPNTAYCYTIAAYDTAGNVSTPSGQSCATTPSGFGVSAVTLSSPTVVGGGSVTSNTVTLNGPAPAGGVTVTLSSNNPAATVPASVMVAAGAAISSAFTISTSVVSISTPVTISGSYNGLTATSTLTVTPAPVASAVTLAFSSVVGGTSTTATASLSAPAPAGGAVVTLKSNNAAAAVPASVTVPAGAAVSPAFAIGTSAVAVNTPVTISATYNSVTVGSTLTVTPPPVPSAVTLTAASVQGGAPTTGTVTLTVAAPAGGAVVTLKSNNAAAIVPATVTVAAGATVSPVFSISTTPVAVNTAVTISATYGGTTAASILNITAPGVSAVTLSQPAVQGGASTTATVSLSGPAAAGGALVTLSSSNPAAVVPASITVAAGATVSPVFTINTTAVSVTTAVTISASYGGTRASATLSVALTAVSSGPVLLVHGNAAEVSGLQNGSVVTPAVTPAGFTGTVANTGGSVNFAPNADGVSFLNCCGNAGNAYYHFTGAGVGMVFGVSQGQVSFNLTSRYSFAQRKASAAGQRYAFDVRDGAGRHMFGFMTQYTAPYLTFTYTAGGSAGTYFVPQGTEDALFGAGVQMQVTVVWGLSGSQLYLNGTRASALTASAAGNWTAASVFDLGAFEYLTYGGYDSSDDTIAEFTVGSPGPTVSVMSPANGTTVSGTVPITAVASAAQGVASVQFRLDGASLGTPDTAAPYSFNWNTTTASNANHRLSALVTDNAGNTATSAAVVVVVNNAAASPAVAAVALSPGTVVGGNPTTKNTVTLSAPAPAGGAVVMLVSSNPAATVPASVTVAAGATVSPVFSIATNPVTATATVTISATYGGTTVTATLLVTPPGPLFLLHGNGSEVSGVQNGALVTPAAQPAGLNGNVVNTGGSVNFAAGGDGVSFLNCCANTSNAYYHFAGTGVGTTFGAAQGQISFNLMSRYSFAQRKSIATGQRWAFDVRDGNGKHLFGFMTQYTVPYLTFSYTAGGMTGTYFVPQGTEDVLFGAGVPMQVTITWGANGSQLFLNGTRVLTVTGTAAGSWTAASVFDLGAYEYLTYGGYDCSDDTIAEFTVSAPGPTVSLISPGNGSTVSGTVTLSSAASAPQSIASVQFLLDGHNQGSADTKAPYNLSWDTTGVSNGSHTLSAVVTDAAGNTGTSSPVTVTVNNPGP